MSARSATQNSGVTPHCPQISQHAFRGQGFSSFIFNMSDGAVVFGTCGPQMALEIGAGIGG